MSKVVSKSAVSGSHYPKVAIVGRPNVGKSSLFNKLIKKRKAIESEVSGTTRDRVSEILKEDDVTFEVIDTGGIHFGTTSLESDMRAQAEVAILDADLILFVISAIDEVTQDDFIVADMLRNSGKTVLLVANKCDNLAISHSAFNLYELGFGEPLLVSSAHNQGMDTLLEAIVTSLKGMKFAKTSDVVPPFTTISIIGRPNVGKSSLFNSILGEKRSIVSDVAGTTRDAVDTRLIRDEKVYVFKDTAGIRRPGRIDKEIEQLSVLRARTSIESCDMVLLVMDYKEGVAKQDLHIAQEAIEQGKGIILVINKSDLMPAGDDSRKTFLDYLQYKCGFLSFVPILFTSALTGKNVDKVFKLIDEIVVERAKRISTSDLNNFFSQVTAKYKPHGTKSYMPKILYATQVEANPPHFIVFVNHAEALHFSYKRYLENQLRATFGFNGTVLKIEYRGRK